MWPQEQEVAHLGMDPCGCHTDFVFDLAGHSPSGINDHPLVLVQANGWAAWIDEGIADDVRLLWEEGIATSYSCQGDQISWRYIALTHGRDTIKAYKLLRRFGWVETIEKGTFYGVRPHA